MNINIKYVTYNIQKDWAREKILNLFETDIRLVYFRK